MRVQISFYMARETVMAASGHRQFCRLAMASDLLCSRWTMMLLSELLSGTTRFNDLRRGLPRMSPALLSRRLKDLDDDRRSRRDPTRYEITY